jgi:hypothetical protein
VVLVVLVRSEAHSGTPQRKVNRGRRTAATTKVEGEHPSRRATRERNFAMEATTATSSPEKGATVVSAPNITRWIGIGLLGLALYGVLTFLSSLNPQPDPNTHYDAWARFVTTDFYLFKHLFVSIIGTVLVIFGTFALGAYLATIRAGAWGWWPWPSPSSAPPCS